MVNKNENLDPLVTVVVPVYNTNVLYLQKCINSVKAQSVFKRIELLIIDDCSTDIKTVQYLKGIENWGYENVFVIHLSQNVGISSSRNQGIKRARGEWICFLDHDDYWEKGYLKKFIDTATHGTLDILIGGYKLVDEDGRYIDRFPISRKKFLSKYYPYSTSAPWNRLIRRCFLIDNDIFFPEGCLTEDIAFNLHCNACARKIVTVESYGYCNRVNTKSTSRGELFVSMPYEMMPFKYLKNIYINVLLQDRRNDVFDGAMISELSILSCVFCRNSSDITRKKAIESSADIMRSYMNHFFLSGLGYLFNVRDKISAKFIYFGLCVSVILHMEKLYSTVITRLLIVFERLVQ